MGSIKNIIFDLGDVIINIDPGAVFEFLAKKGIQDVAELHEKLINNNIYNELETGLITADEFRTAIKNAVDFPLHDDEINAAWNSMILDIPPERVKFMTKLKSKYKLYLLSNTNHIHWKHYDQYFQDHFDYPSLNTFFTKTWYSYLMGVRKPNPEIFRMALEDGQLNPSETVFIDDIKENVEAAATHGIVPCHLPEGKEIMDLFDGNLTLIS